MLPEEDEHSLIEDMDIAESGLLSGLSLEVDNIATIKDLVRQRYGVSVLAESACMDEIMKKKLVALPIEQLNMKREINIIYTKGFQYEAFADEIVRTYRELL